MVTKTGSRSARTPSLDGAESRQLLIPPPKLVVAAFRISGTSPYLQGKFSHKAKQQMMHVMATPSSRKTKAREPRDYEADLQAATHRSEEGWIGIPAVAFRQAMVSACKLVGFEMTKAKICVFVEHDGVDAEDGTPLIRIEGDAERSELPVQRGMTTDIAVRPMFRKWSATVRIRFDLGWFSPEDIANLLLRVGQQIGIGAGRPDSKRSTGMGFGLFRLESDAQVEEFKP